MIPRSAVLVGVPLVLAAACVSGVEPPTLQAEELADSGMAGSSVDGGFGGQGGGAGSDSGAGGAGSVGPCGNPSSQVAGAQCAACLEASCCEVAAPCMVPGACLSLVKCVSRCADSACAEACQDASTPTAVSQALALKTCWVSSCSSDCPASEATNNLVGGLGSLTGRVPVDCGSANQCENLACGDCNGDASDACETDLLSASNCGECGRSCGAATCDPAGACTAEQIVTGSAVALAVDAGALAWTDPKLRAAHWLPAGSSVPVRMNVSWELNQDFGIALTPTELFFGADRTAFRSPLPPSGDAVGFFAGRAWVLSASTDWVYLRPNSGTPEGVRRMARVAATGGYVLCVGPFQDAVADASDTTYVAERDGVVRYPASAWTSACGGAPAGATLVSGVAAQRLRLGGQRLFYVGGAPGAAEIHAVPLSGGTSELLGLAATFNNAGYNAPIAAHGDTVFWVARDPLRNREFEHLLMSRTGSEPPRALAVVGTNVNSLAADASYVYIGTTHGVFRTPR